MDAHWQRGESSVRKTTHAPPDPEWDLGASLCLATAGACSGLGDSRRRLSGAAAGAILPGHGQAASAPRPARRNRSPSELVCRGDASSAAVGPPRPDGSVPGGCAVPGRVARPARRAGLTRRGAPDHGGRGGCTGKGIGRPHLPALRAVWLGVPVVGCLHRSGYPAQPLRRSHQPAAPRRLAHGSLPRRPCAASRPLGNSFPRDPARQGDLRSMHSQEEP